MDSISKTLENFYQINILEYLQNLKGDPIKLVVLIVDIILVIGLLYWIVKVVKHTRAMQLIKGILLLVAITFLSKLLHLNILNYILTSFMTYRSYCVSSNIPTRIKKGIRAIRYK